MNSKRLDLWRNVTIIILLLPLIFYGWRIFQRPPRIDFQQQLFTDVIYQRKVLAQPRPYLVHQIAIDLDNTRIEPFVTPTINNSHNLALTTSEFVRKYNLQLAINGSFFYPFAEDHPGRFYPQNGQIANALGENIARGKRYGKKGDRWSVLCFNASNSATIVEKSCPPNAVWGIAGRELLVKNGKTVVFDNDENYGRSAVGIDTTGKKLWLLAIDGKQPFYSEGVTLVELAELFVSLGCDRALNLDGGGSSTLVVNKNNQITVLNAPIHTKIPMRQRPVANHLGFSILP